MTKPNNLRQAQIRSLIERFLQERLTSRVEKLGDDDPNRNKLKEQFQPDVWLEDAARRAAQIQAVTHTLKAIHPDAKGTNCHVPPAGLVPLDVVGSHCLGDDYELDVVGNAAALDVYKFLRLEYQGDTLLDLALKSDADFAAALSSDTALGENWMRAFAALLQPKGKPSSHTYAKQLYWPVADDVHDESSFHLLEPLYASSLAHKVYLQVQEDRFGEAALAARNAWKTHVGSDHAVHLYPDLAIQKLGGTKPQNISQLNSQRRGDNPLFASLPPQWASGPVKPVLYSESMFVRFEQRPQVRAAVRVLAQFLASAPASNQDSRTQRATDVDQVIDEFLVFTAELRELAPGWSQQPECKLKRTHALWLDPLCAPAPTPDDNTPLPDAQDVLSGVSADFALWFNHQLGHNKAHQLPVGDPEYHEWRRLMLDALQELEREGNHV